MPDLSRHYRHLTPARVTFAASLMLSLIAHLGGMLNRDGMLYVTTARAFLDGGFVAAKAMFSWPFLSILMALVSQATGLGLENAGHLLNTLFMAGACTLLVKNVERLQPETAWWAALAVLAIPGLNEYRHELIREFGCWFFIMLALWQALRWNGRPTWVGALLIQVVLAMAMLFRPEAAALFPALLLWQLFEAPRHERLRRLLQLGALPLAGAVAVLALYFSGHLDGGHRLAGEIQRFKAQGFDAKAQALAAALIDYAKGDAGTILFFGSLAIVPIKIVARLGIFVLPLVFLGTSHLRLAFYRHPLFAWCTAFQLMVVSVFVIDQQFLAGRYVGPILLFMAPFVGIGLRELAVRYPRWRLALVGAALLIMLANIISLSPGKTHFVTAGKWLAENATESSRVYLESGRAAYYAGWSLKPTQKDRSDELIQRIRQGDYELLVFEVSRKDAPIDAWLERSGVRVLQRFEHTRKDAVIVAIPGETADGRHAPGKATPPAN
ncbi:glycosyltransferase family 39 protein [Propionivibrio limicola]|uniref:glycosyltransferase family 39 protein n=1 Tax=Propionivibrio limicola TaxID=167645 RepID=UPI0012926F6A|nr:glycosyltransferase family 39 protein [Propionivibrio limicola]